MSQTFFFHEVSKTAPVPLIDRPIAGRPLRMLHRPLRILMVSAVFRLSYRVLRCAEAAGAEIYILGSSDARGLCYSRSCKKFIPSSIAFDGTARPEVLDEINSAVAKFEIDLVMPSDAPCTRMVIALKDQIAAPCFPLPALNIFDALNNKSAFTEICRELGILCPPSQLFETKQKLLDAINDGDITFPALAKPLSMDGSNGIVRLEAANARERIKQIDYRPILVQDFIAGEDIGASVYCENGEIRSHVLHRLKRWHYSTFDDDNIRDALARIMRRMGVDGVYNFDMRLAKNGDIYFLECNPRFFYKINLSMLTGINFVRAGLPIGKPTLATVAPQSGIRMPKAMLMALLTPWRLKFRDFSMLAYLYSDPIPYIREALRIDW